MGGYNSIDTDLGIGTILSHFDSEYIRGVVEESLANKFRPFEIPMPNMVDVLNRQFAAILDHSPDYKEQVIETRDETYREIIRMICSYYNLSFMVPFEELDPLKLYSTARTLYDIFISRFTDCLFDFFINYIKTNTSSIINYLNNNPNTKKPREDTSIYIDPKFAIIHANINMILYNMATYDISLDQILHYILQPGYYEVITSMLRDNGDFYKNHYAIYVVDEQYKANTLTNIKLKLQAQTQNAASIQ